MMREGFPLKDYRDGWKHDTWHWINAVSQQHISHILTAWGRKTLRTIWRGSLENRMKNRGMGSRLYNSKRFRWPLAFVEGHDRIILIILRAGRELISRHCTWSRWFVEGCLTRRLCPQSPVKKGSLWLGHSRPSQFRCQSSTWHEISISGFRSQEGWGGMKGRKMCLSSSNAYQ